MKTNGAVAQSNEAYVSRFERLEKDMGDIVAFRREQSIRDIDLADAIAESKRSYESLVAMGVLETTRNYAALDKRVYALEVKIDTLATKSDLSDLDKRVSIGLAEMKATLRHGLILMTIFASIGLAGQYGLVDAFKAFVAFAMK
jgi:hypothetical protein